MKTNINYKSDFQINEKSERIAMEVPFIFSYYVFDNREYVVSFDGKEYVNCERKEDGSLDVFFNNHNLGIGPLRVERKFFISDEAFADGVFDVVTNDKTEIFLSSGSSEMYKVETVVIPPYLKGDRGEAMRWETMTEEERSELVQNVAEAIDPEMVMTENEQARIEAEKERQASETQREESFTVLKDNIETTISEGNAATEAAKDVVKNYDEKVQEQDAKISELGSKMELFAGFGGIRQSGAIAEDNTTFILTDYLYYRGGMTITGYDGGTANTWRACAFYDKNKDVIGVLNTGEDTANVRTVVLDSSNVPEGAVYIRVSTQASKPDSEIDYHAKGIVRQINYVDDRQRKEQSATSNMLTLLDKSIVETKFIDFSSDEQTFVIESKAIKSDYNTVGASTSELYVIRCNQNMLLNIQNLSNISTTTKLWAVYRGVKQSDIISDNAIVELSDKNSGLRYGGSVVLNIPSGCLVVMARNLSYDSSPIVEAKIVEGSEELLDGEGERVSIYNGESNVFDILEDFVINTASGSAHTTYDTWYYTAKNNGAVRIISQGDAKFVRLAVTSDINIGKAPDYYIQTSDTNTPLEFKQEQIVCVSANKGKIQWELEVTDVLHKLREDIILPQVGGIEKELGKLEEKVISVENGIKDFHNDNKNAYKGYAPYPFREKILMCEKDIDIVLLGDSVTALTNVGDELTNASNLPAGCQHNAITYQLWNYLCKNKQQCDRFDSLVHTFSENGAFSVSDVSKQNGTSTNGNYGEHSEDNCLYRETSTPNDSVSFDWNLDDYEKLNLIGRMSIYGSRSITISCENGKVLVQHNGRANPKEGVEDNAWVEANGYNITQYLDYSTTANNAWYVRNLPIKFRKADGATGVVTITITNTCNAADVNTGNSSIPSTTMYYWGTERWNGTTVRVTNCGRAGRTTELHIRSIKQELTYRDIDLVVWQLPLWNELKVGGNPIPDIASAHNQMIGYFKQYSEDFSKFQVIVNMVHTQLASWVGNKNIRFQANGLVDRPITDLTDWECCSKILKNILDNENYSEGKLVAANLYNEVYNYAQSNGLTMQELLDTEADTNIGDGTTSSGADSEAFTVDGTHLSSYGFEFYASLIAPMMYK